MAPPTAPCSPCSPCASSSRPIGGVGARAAARALALLLVPLLVEVATSDEAVAPWSSSSNSSSSSEVNLRPVERQCPHEIVAYGEESTAVREESKSDGEEELQWRMPDVYNFCCPDVEQGKYGHVNWPPTHVGVRTSQPCPYGARADGPEYGFAKVHRKCMRFSVGPQWSTSDYSQCRPDEDPEEADAAENARNAEQITSNPSNITGETFRKAVDLIKKARSVALTNRTVADNMLRALSNLVEARAEVQADGDQSGQQRVGLFDLIEEHGRGVRLAKGESVYEKRLPNLHLRVETMPSDTEDMLSAVVFDVNFDASSSPSAMVQVSLPAEAIQKVLDDNPGTQRNEVRVRFSAVRNARLLPPPGMASGLQPVVSASVSPSPAASPTRATGADELAEDHAELGEDFIVRGLQAPVAIRMPLGEWGVSHICAYFDMNSSEWRSDGVRTLLAGAEAVLCETDHLTPFTLLLDPYPRRGLGDMLMALNVVSYLGSALSVLGLLATIVTYQCLSRFGEDRWGRVLVQLCLALLLLHLVALSSNLKGAVPAGGCVAVAVLLHLFLLSSFFWMLVEGLLLYQLLITVFQSANSKFILKRLIFAWGLPVAIVGACAAADPSYYLDTHPDFCVVSGRNGLQHGLATLLPCGAVLAANALIFVRISLVLVRRRNPPGYRPDAADSPPITITWAQVRGVVGVAFLLGVTWVLSPLASDVAALQVASAALNALQGAAIFVSRVLTHPEARRSWSHRFFPKTEFGTTSASYSVSDKGSSWFPIRWSNASGTVATLPRSPKSSRRWSSPLGRHIATSRGSSSSISLAITNSSSEAHIL